MATQQTPTERPRTWFERNGPVIFVLGGVLFIVIIAMLAKGC